MDVKNIKVTQHATLGGVPNVPDVDSHVVVLVHRELFVVSLSRLRIVGLFFGSGLSAPTARVETMCVLCIWCDFFGN